MHNIVLINRDKQSIHKLRNILASNSELEEYYEDKLCFLANRLPGLDDTTKPMHRDVWLPVPPPFRIAR